MIALKHGQKLWAVAISCASDPHYELATRVRAAALHHFRALEVQAIAAKNVAHHAGP